MVARNRQEVHAHDSLQPMACNGLNGASGEQQALPSVEHAAAKGKSLPLPSPASITLRRTDAKWTSSVGSMAKDARPQVITGA